MITLRDYQRDAVTALWRYFEEADDCPLIVQPTGSGKSVVIAGFVASVLEQFPDQRFLVLTHVRELIEQNAAKLEALLPFGTVGVYSAGLRRRERSCAVTVASVQSLAARLRDLPTVDLVLIDECHLVPPEGEGRYRTVLSSLRALNPAVKVIGFSATPFRLKTGWLHRGKGRIFTDIAHEVAIAPLIAQGYLCPLRSKSGASSADLSRVHVRGGEYVPAEVEAAMMETGLVERTLDEVERHCADRRKWLVFCAGIQHAARVAEELGRRGHRVATVTGEMPNAERDAVLGAFARGELRAVVNVNVLTTGFDAPDIDAVVLMRATKSAGLYSQIVGRAMRPHPSKADALVLDFGGNVLRHGPVDALNIREHTDTPGAAPVKSCPECREVVAASARVCTECGAAFPEPKKKEPHGVVASDLPILNVPVDVPIDGVRYALHRKAGKPDSMRVEYRAGLTYYREWVCLEHDGFAARRAQKWWRQRGGLAPVPVTTADALARVVELRTPETITVRREGEFWGVTGARFAEAAE